MKRLFLFTIFTALIFQANGQAPFIDIGPDTVTCPPDCIDLTADFIGGGNTTDYTVEDITYAPDPYAGTTRSLSDDGVSTPIDIGFDFCFYGSTYDQFYIAANGWIGFTGGPGTWGPITIPSTGGTVPKNCIMGPWQDLNPGLGGTVQYQVLGVAPLRRLVVSWQVVPYFSCTDQFGTQQIILYESTNIIENHVETKIVCGGWAGGRAVQGIHNAAGTEAVVNPGRNNTVWTATDEAIRYTPLGDPVIEWYSGPFLIGTGADITLCPSSTTTYTAKLIACGTEIATDDIVIEVICCEPPIMSGTAVSCFGGCDGTATADPIGAAPFTYEWDALAGGQTTATAIDLCAGTYTVTVTDALGCIETGEYTVEEPEELTGSILSTTAVSCFGLADGEVSAEGLGGSGSLSYDIGGGPFGIGDFTGLGAGVYDVTIIDSLGCTLVLPFEITSPDLLEVTLISSEDISCNGGSDGEIVINGIGGTAPYQFSIDGGPYGISPSFTDLTAGGHSLTVLDANGCLATLDVDLTEPPLLVITIDAVTNITCFGGDDGIVTVSGSGGVGPYEYAFDGGAYVADGTFTGISEGTYSVAVRDANDCESLVDVILTQAPEIEIDETIIGETCLGDCLGEITIEGTTGVAPFNYSIDDCATSDLIGVYTDLCAGDYEVCIVDADGCEYTTTVVVPDGVTPADATITPFGPLCLDDAAVTMSAVSPGGVFSGPGVVGGSFDPSIAGVGTHTITNTIDIGCGDIATFDVTVNPLPVSNFMANITVECEPMVVSFENTGDIGEECIWDFGDGISTFCGSVNHTYHNSGEYDVSLTVVDINGCSSTTTFYDYIEVFEVPNAVFRFGPQPTTTINTEINFTDMSTAAVTWDWTFDDLGNSTDQNPTFDFPDVPENYDITLVVESENGCIDSTSQTVVISEQFLIYVPNTITPDGDTYNEVFLPYFNGIDIYDYTLYIYNRWGEILFESHDVEVGWDGTYGGEIVEQGVYIWQIITQEITSDKKLEFNGHVTVLK